MRLPPRTRTRAFARRKGPPPCSDEYGYAAAGLRPCLQLCTRGSPPVGTHVRNGARHDTGCKRTNRHRALGTSVPNDTRVITLPCSMKHGIYISGKGGGLIPMTSFRAVMDASWCATVRLPPSHRDPHSSGFILSYLTMQNIGFLCKLCRHYTIPLRNTSTQRYVCAACFRSLPHRTNSSQVPEVHAVGLEDVWPQCAVFGYIS
ncbi:hypothetical protein BC834DRAFT_919180, partial [Gloeopeniophorella convolvens]